MIVAKLWRYTHWPSVGMLSSGFRSLQRGACVPNRHTSSQDEQPSGSRAGAAATGTQVDSVLLRYAVCEWCDVRQACSKCFESFRPVGATEGTRDRAVVSQGWWKIPLRRRTRMGHRVVG